MQYNHKLIKISINTYRCIMNNDYIKVKIVGKNINNYIKWLISKKIDILRLNIINHNELNIIINYKYLNLLTKYSPNYKVIIVKKYGRLAFFEKIKNNQIILVCILISISFLYFLSNIIFSVDVIYNDHELSAMIKNELEKYDIKKYKLKRDYEYIENVKKEILEKNKEILEWIEIEEKGTKYVVRLVERKKEKVKKEFSYQSVVASKDAVIKSIKAYSGEKVKNVNDFVMKEDVIISGILTKPDGTNLYTKAIGIIYGEVWYKVSIEYPLYYYEEQVTGKNKNVPFIYFLSKKIALFPYKKYKQFKILSNVIIEDNYIPLKIVKEKLYEVNIKEDIYTEEDAINKAIEVAKIKMQEKNSKILKINEVIIISRKNLDSKIGLELFISVDEDITKIVEIKEEVFDKVKEE